MNRHGSLSLRSTGVTNSTGRERQLVRLQVDQHLPTRQGDAASGQPAADAGEAEAVSEPTRTVCTVYRPRECWYHVSDPEQPPATPPCASKQRCGFNMTERLACPFWQSGTFDSVETEARCSVCAVFNPCPQAELMLA